MAAAEKRAWLREQGVRFFPVVGWAERGGYLADGPGNSVPRFHITWGTGPGVVEPFERRVRAGVERGLVRLALPAPGRRADVTDGAVDGVTRRGARAQRRAAGRAVVPDVDRRVHACAPRR